jgi:hypothetical protein
VQGCNEDDSGKLKYSEENLATISQHKCNMDCPRSNPGFSEQWSTANHLNDVTAHHGLTSKWSNDDIHEEGEKSAQVALFVSFKVGPGIHLEKRVKNKSKPQLA